VAFFTLPSRPACRRAGGGEEKRNARLVKVCLPAGREGKRKIPTKDGEEPIKIDLRSP